MPSVVGKLLIQPTGRIRLVTQPRATSRRADDGEVDSWLTHFPKDFMFDVVETSVAAVRIDLEILPDVVADGLDMIEDRLGRVFEQNSLDGQSIVKVDPISQHVSLGGVSGDDNLTRPRQIIIERRHALG